MAQDIARPQADAATAFRARRSGWQNWGLLTSVRRFARKRTLSAVAGLFVIFFALLAIFADVITPYGVSERGELLASPSLAHPFGTDQLGRDTLTRVIYGARLSLGIGLVVTIASSVMGLLIGVSAGYFSGKVDKVLVMLLDAMMAFPGLILTIALVTALGQSVQNVIIAIMVGFVARVARLVRSNVLSVRGMPYVEAARSIGAGDIRIVLRHIVPNVMAIVIILASLNFAVAMLVEGSLAFLGLGAPPPTPSWGRMLSEEGQQFFRSAPWLGFFPGLALALAVLGFNLLGDGLRDHLDPRLRER